MEVLRVRDALETGKGLKRVNPNSLLTFHGKAPLIQICRRTKHPGRVRFNNSFETRLPSDGRDWI